MSIEAMKQWREALACALSDDKPYIDRCKQAIESIDQTIAEAEKKAQEFPKRFDTHPQPKRELVGLTTAEFDEIHDNNDTLHDAMWATIAKLKEKNT